MRMRPDWCRPMFAAARRAPGRAGPWPPAPPMRRMRVGISLASAQPGASDAEAATRVLARARAAAAAGLASLTLGDHHSNGPMPYVQNVPMLGRLLAEWDARPAGCLFLVPLWNPVLMAEQIGTLAAIAQGPFIVQTGLGSRGEIEAMGMDVPHRAKRLEASVAVMKALLAGERVDDEDLGVRGAAIAPLPPHGIEWWFGTHTEHGLDRCARLGDAWYANANLDVEMAAAQLPDYLAACERHDVTPTRIVIRKDVFVTDDDARGVEVGQRLIDAGYRGGWGRGAVAFGGVDHVVEQLTPFADLGFTDVIVRTMVGVEQDEAVRSIELAGEVARAFS
jgi:alkanesulfonate monooxygenase SsuD/methylene tetrahydromethanopterin reductase-like flavin-dependent oxidoreductase (luciferase family)